MSTVFWVVDAPLIQARFGGTYCLHLQGKGLSHARRKSLSLLLASFFVGLFFGPKDGGNMFLRNVGEILAYYTESQPNQQHS
jgi:hypothetical protein